MYRMDQANTVAQLSWRTEGSNRCCEASAGRTLERVRLLVRSSRRSSDALGRRRNPVTMPRPTFPPLGRRYPRVGLARSLAASARQPPVELWVPRAGRCASSQGLARHASQRCPRPPSPPLLAGPVDRTKCICRLVPARCRVCYCSGCAPRLARPPPPPRSLPVSLLRLPLEALVTRAARI